MRGVPVRRRPLARASLARRQKPKGLSPLGSRLVAALALWAGAAGCGGPSALDLDGRPTDPLAEPGVATVLLFVAVDCPISNRYAPEMGRLHDAFAPRGVTFWLVYPDRATRAAAIAEHRAEYRLPAEALRDPEHALVGRSGVRVTPEAAVFDGAGELVYRGRIDNWYEDFGRSRPAPTERELRDALEALLGGQPVPEARTEAVGCFIATDRDS